MTKKLSIPADPTTREALREIAARLLADGKLAGDLSYELARTATRLGLDLAPSMGVALAGVMQAARDVALAWTHHHCITPDGAAAPQTAIKPTVLGG
jgi:hypothetical protein